MPRARTAPPKDSIDGRRRLDAWRETRRTRAMPEDLWALAARLGYDLTPTEVRRSVEALMAHYKQGGSDA